MQYTIVAPAHLDTTVSLPASKSISNRALLISAISGGEFIPENLSDCDDTVVMIDALQRMPDTIDIKAAGTAMRFLTAYLAATDGTHVITGTERMKQRPVGLLVDALRKLGADIEYLGEEGYPPLKITGRKLRADNMLEMPGNISSQFVSALLMIAPTLEKGLELKLTERLTSRPYIDLTLCMMKDYGAEAGWVSADMLKVAPKPYVPRPMTVESDWSAAGFWYEIMALTQDPHAEVRMEGLVDGSRQGDAVARYLFSLLGVKTKFATAQQGVSTTVTLRSNGRTMPRLDYDFANQPDIAQPLAVSCCLAGVKFCFKGLSTLRIKETDRMEALKQEMCKLGYVLRAEGEDMLLWDGERCEADIHPVINTYEDHRMAMSFAPVSLVLPEVSIAQPQVVSKSYPGFWDDLRKAGFTVS